MAPSIYIGCEIDDDIGAALDAVNQTYRDVEKEINTAIDALEEDINQLSGNKTKASETLGTTTDNKIFWEAVEEGTGGNEISITYVYQAPTFNPAIPPIGAFEKTDPTSSVTDKSITLYLGANADGSVMTATENHDEWILNSDVTDLVTSTIVGSGDDPLEPIGNTYLSGGKGAPLSDAEGAADLIAKQFNQNSYQDLMRSINIPVIENEADAVAYLESLDEGFIVLNRKLILTEGSNLVGIRLLYNVLHKDAKKLKDYLTKIANGQYKPHLFTTRGYEFTDYSQVCGELQEVVTIREVFQDYNTPLQSTADKVADGNISAINGYIFWSVETTASTQNYNKLSFWGYPDELLDDILAGETPDVEDYFGDVAIPVVAVIDNPYILEDYDFTISEIEELMEKEEVAGIRPPSQDDPEKRNEAITNVLAEDQSTLPNGMHTRVKKAVALGQSVDLTKTGNDKDLSKEMATKGKACARQKKNMATKKPKIPIPDLKLPGNAALKEQLEQNGVSAEDLKLPQFQSPNLPSLDIPNLPTEDLPDLAKKVESAFGAISSVVKTALGVFDRVMDKLFKAAEGMLNKVQNLMSMADNLLKNDLAKCLLGLLPPVTGITPPASLGNLGNIGSLPPIGGLSLPLQIFTLALNEMTIAMDLALTVGFEGVMKQINTPICMLKALMEELLGFELPEGIENPCKKPKDPNDDCPPKETQETINESKELSAVSASLPHLDQFPTSELSQEISEKVAEFTGLVQKTITETQETITRGIKQIMEDVTKSLNSKLEAVNKIGKSIQQIMDDVSEMAKISEAQQKADENGEKKTDNSCAPPAMGLLTEAVVDFI